MSTADSAEPDTVKNKTLLALGFGHVSMFYSNQGFLLFAIPFYQMTLGLDPFLLSLCSVIPMVIATTLKPWIGHLSDGFHSRYGRRKPFLFCAAIASGCLYGVLWSVPLEWSDNHKFLYLGGFSLLFHIAGSFYSIPLKCMAFEASDSSYQRTRIFAVTNIFSRVCGMTYQWAFPLTQLAIFGSIFAGVKIVGWVIGLLLIVTMGVIPVFFLKEKPVTQVVTEVSLATKIKTVSRNPDFLYLMLLVTLIVLGIGCSVSMDYYLLVYFVSEGDIAQGAVLKGALSSAYALLGILYIPVVLYMTRKIGKLNTLKLIFLIAAMSGLVKWFLFVPSIGWWIVLDAVFSNFVWTGNALIIPSLIADLCAKHEKQCHYDIKGIFISMHSWVNYISKAVALLALGIILNTIDFDANLGSMQTDDTLYMMRITLSFGTASIALLILFLLFNSRLRKL
ncbi:MFS transporter [Paraglaciecola chathamensis]|uniref:MFS transporter n=1 Tax=Paraglaciecola chathamensis TaxID=368405 RepID=UPI0026FABE7F|nr:MFS transporter [Paraglaciecola chathamensis]MDO6560756.1 MFS transporter [Paraglaciecola chathamensis]